MAMKQTRVSVAVLGAGRIGQVHAHNLAQLPEAKLVGLFDPQSTYASAVAQAWGVQVYPTTEHLLGDAQVQAVVIATPTPTHVPLIVAATEAGKHVFCEKPIALDMLQVKRCEQALASSQAKTKLQIGFNRRFDPAHEAIREAIHTGSLGVLQQLLITSRDADFPPADYLPVSGGLFRDMVIHDFDLACHLCGEEPQWVFAAGAARIDAQRMEQNKDVDGAFVVLRMASGALCHIAASRRSGYGYDQRVEALGTDGMLRSENVPPMRVERFAAQHTHALPPLSASFTERYADAYRNELRAFLRCIREDTASPCSFEDGRRALLLATCAEESLRTGHTVPVHY